MLRSVQGDIEHTHLPRENWQEVTVWCPGHDFAGPLLALPAPSPKPKRPSLLLHQDKTTRVFLPRLAVQNALGYPSIHFRSRTSRADKNKDKEMEMFAFP